MNSMYDVLSICVCMIFDAEESISSREKTLYYRSQQSVILSIVLRRGAAFDPRGNNFWHWFRSANDYKAVPRSHALSTV
jgi:hypothetical protein